MNPTPPTTTSTSASRPARSRRSRAPSTLSGMFSVEEDVIVPSSRTSEPLPNSSAAAPVVTSSDCCEKLGKDLIFDRDAQEHRPVSVVEVVLRHHNPSSPSRRRNQDSEKDNKMSSAEDERRFLSRQLRRAKRRLLLKAVEPPSRPADRLRDMLRQLSLDSSADGGDNNDFGTDSRSFDCPSSMSLSDAEDTIPSRS